MRLRGVTGNELVIAHLAHAFHALDKALGRQSGAGRLEALNQQIETPTLVCGELSAEERQVLARRRKSIQLATPAQSVRRPSYLAELAWKRWKAGQVDPPAELSPIYLHYNDPIPV